MRDKSAEVDVSSSSSSSVKQLQQQQPAGPHQQHQDEVADQVSSELVFRAPSGRQLQPKRAPSPLSGQSASGDSDPKMLAVVKQATTALQMPRRRRAESIKADSSPMLAPQMNKSPSFNMSDDDEGGGAEPANLFFNFTSPHPSPMRTLDMAASGTAAKLGSIELDLNLDKDDTSALPQSSSSGGEVPTMMRPLQHRAKVVAEDDTAMGLDDASIAGVLSLAMMDDLDNLKMVDSNTDLHAASRSTTKLPQLKNEITQQDVEYYDRGASKKKVAAAQVATIQTTNIIAAVVPQQAQPRVKQSVKRWPPFIFSDQYEFKSIEALDDEYRELLDIQYTEDGKLAMPVTSKTFYPRYADPQALQMEAAAESKQVIKGGALPTLIEALTGEDADTEYIAFFLMTYQYFVEPVDFARLLVLRYLDCKEKLFAVEQLLATPIAAPVPEDKKRISSMFNMKRESTQQAVVRELTQAQKYEIDTQVLIQTKVLNVIRKWVDGYVLDFTGSTQVTALLKKFIAVEMVKDTQKLSMAATLKKLNAAGSNATASPTSATPTESKRMTLPANLYVSGPTDCDLISILEVNADAFVKELALAEQSNYARIQLSEMFQQGWSHKDKVIREVLSPNLLASVQWFNRIAYGVASQIVMIRRLKDRVEALKTFIYIAHESAKLRNYNSCFEIVAGMNLGAVSRLKATWKALPKKYVEAWSQLNFLVTNEANYKVYRHAMLVEVGFPPEIPLVPYLGMFLSDLTFIEDGNPTYLMCTNEKLPPIVNFARCRMLAVVFRYVITYQQKKFDFSSNAEVKQYLQSQWKVLSEADMYKESKLNEPSQNSSSQAGSGSPSPTKSMKQSPSAIMQFKDANLVQRKNSIGSIKNLPVSGSGGSGGSAGKESQQNLSPTNTSTFNQIRSRVRGMSVSAGRAGHTLSNASIVPPEMQQQQKQ